MEQGEAADSVASFTLSTYFSAGCAPRRHGWNLIPAYVGVTMTGGDIVFSSLLLGLMAGIQPVSVDIAPGKAVQTVRFLLDGQVKGQAGATTGWQAEIDFGARLLPHQLMAVALDDRGRELDRAERWVNVPHAPARLDILIDRDESCRPVAARLVATSVVKDRPVNLTLTLDGSRVEVDSAGRGKLPIINLAQAHLLSGIAEFSPGAVARSDLVLGGQVADESGSRLSAVAVRWTGRSEPAPESLAGRIQGPNGPLRPVAVEKGDTTILLVRHPSSNEALQHLGRPKRDFPMKFDPDDRVGFIWPLTRAIAGGSMRADLFESMNPFSVRGGDYFWLLTRVSRPGSTPRPPYRFADAVAIAGMEACAARTRRAVVLVLGDERHDASEFSPAQVVGYLEALGVPLHVWSLVDKDASPWGSVQARTISSFAGLALAVDALKRDLATQRVVWVAGEWAPGQAVISPVAHDISLVH
jgi:hypothetical protein